MDKIKTLSLMILRAFGPVGTILGAAITVLGGWSDFLFGKDALTSASREQLILIGLSLFVVCGAALLLRIEWRFRDVDSYLGNEHKRALWADGIPALREEYFRHIRSGDFAIVNRFWLAGFANLTDANGRTDLHAAAEAGQAAIVSGIIQRGGDPRRADRHGNTPLMLAIIQNHTKTVEKLLEHDPAVNARAEKGYSAVFVASVHGHNHIIDLLSKEDANIDQVNNANISPVMAAISRNHWSTVRRLIDAGADLTKVDAAGATLMDYALAFHADPDIVEKLKAQGIKVSPLGLRQAGSGFSHPGDVSVDWRRTGDEADRRR